VKSISQKVRVKKVSATKESPLWLKQSLIDGVKSAILVYTLVYEEDKI